MTKKEQAEKELVGFLSVNTDGMQISRWVITKAIRIVHAIDEAEREDRGVVDVQEISGCEDCNHLRHREILEQKTPLCGLKKLESVPAYIPAAWIKGTPPWCPRRKENKP
jgi:hypothetical protein